MARRFAKVSEEEIKTAFFYPSDLVNTKTEERVSVYIPHYSPPLRGIVVHYTNWKKSISTRENNDNFACFRLLTRSLFLMNEGQCLLFLKL